jgi:hypothetical protein
MLFLGTVVALLVVAGGVALALNCSGGNNPCVGTEGDDLINGTDLASGDKIYAKGYMQRGGTTRYMQVAAAISSMLDQAKRQ